MRLFFELDYDATDDVLVAGTMGRGAWKLPEASLEFNSSTGFDFGDAPASYRVTTAANGPRHRTTGRHSASCEIWTPMVAHQPSPMVMISRREMMRTGSSLSALPHLVIRSPFA